MVVLEAVFYYRQDKYDGSGLACTIYIMNFRGNYFVIFYSVCSQVYC